MKRLILLTALFSSTLFAADAPPAVSVRDAVKIAEDSLARRGLEKELYIAGVTLERKAFLSGSSFWFVKWSHAIPARNPNNREVGIKVRMDGVATILVKEPGTP